MQVELERQLIGLVRFGHTGLLVQGVFLLMLAIVFAVLGRDDGWLLMIPAGLAVPGAACIVAWRWLARTQSLRDVMGRPAGTRGAT